MNKSLAVGTIVRYKKPVDDAERRTLFVVTEDKGDRVDIQPIKTNMPITPTECLLVDDLIVVRSAIDFKSPQ